MTPEMQAMADHYKECEALANKYIGKACLAHGRQIKDMFFKKQWYAYRIYDLGIMEGQLRARQRRCKRTDSPVSLECDKIILDLYLVKETIILELIALEEPAPK